MKALWILMPASSVHRRMSWASDSKRSSGQVGSTRSNDSCTVSRPRSSRTSGAQSSGVTQRLTQNERFTPNGIALNLLLFGSAHGQSAYHVAADEHCEDGHR